MKELGIFSGVDSCLRTAWRSCIGSGKEAFSSLSLIALALWGPLQHRPWNGYCLVPGALGRLTACVHRHYSLPHHSNLSKNRVQVPGVLWRTQAAPLSRAAFPGQPPSPLEPPGHAAALEDLGCRVQTLREEAQGRRSGSSSTSVPCGNGPGWGVKHCLRLSQGNVISLE